MCLSDVQISVKPADLAATRWVASAARMQTLLFNARSASCTPHKKRFGKGDERPGTEFDVRTKGGCGVQHLFASQLPFAIAAVYGAGYLGDAEGRGIKGNGRADEIADAFRIRVVKITLDDSRDHDLRK